MTNCARRFSGVFSWLKSCTRCTKLSDTSMSKTRSLKPRSSNIWLKLRPLYCPSGSLKSWKKPRMSSSLYVFKNRGTVLIASSPGASCAERAEAGVFIGEAVRGTLPKSKRSMREKKKQLRQRIQKRKPHSQ